MHNHIIGGSDKCKWIVTLPATKADSQTAYTITAKSQKYGSINISDVLFGDVWVCSGQSNMQFALPQVHGVVLPELQITYLNIRFITLQLRLPRLPIIPMFGYSQLH